DITCCKVHAAIVRAGRTMEVKPCMFKLEDKLNIRCLYLRLPDIIHASHSADICQDGDIPLFLGADVLAGCDQDSKNHGRIHQRFTKEGLATKLSVQGANIEGVRSTGFYMYSIQGVFNAVFRYHSKETQRIYLTYFKDVWLARFSDPPLEGAITANWYLDLKYHSNQMTLDSNVINITPELPLEMLDTVAVVQAQRTVSIVTEESSMVTRTLENANVAQRNAPTSQIESNNVEVHEEPIDTQREYIDKDKKHVDQFLSFHLSHMQKYIHNILRRKEVTTDQSKKQHLENLLILIKSFSEDILSDAHTFPYELLTRFCSIRHDKKSMKKFRNGFDLPQKKCVLLSIVSEWLGKEFHELRKDIFSNVERFKLEHIQSINDLPPPQSLVEELFPECMQVLLVNWLGHQRNTQEETNVQNSSFKSDANYQEESVTQQTVQIQEETITQEETIVHEPSTKRHKIDKLNDSNKSSGQLCADSDMYSFIQVVLEFMNNSLISGVAHVVYSRLIHGNV
ncbi:unnamed protein product, partial [Owenia fusiformis]